MPRWPRSPRTSVSRRRACSAGWRSTRKLVHQLNRRDMAEPVGHVGASADNAAIVKLFSLPQQNIHDRRVWNIREELRIAIVAWIERTYHRRRRQAALGRLTPVEYELIMKPAAIQAA